MSLIKLQGNASGTGAFTIAAPNGNTDRTLTLPDATGTVLAAPAGAVTISSSAPSNSLTLDGSGNLGLGVAPSAYGTSTRGLDINSWAAFAAVGGSTFVGFNSYSTSTSAYAYKNTGAIALGYSQNTGGHVWYTAPSGTAGNAVTFTQAMTLDPNRNLLVGATSTSGFATQTGGSAQLYLMGLTFHRNDVNTSGRYWYSGPEGNSAGTYLLYNANNTGVYLGYGSTSWAANSDERMKTTLVPFEDAVGKVCSLRAGTGRYLTDEEDVSRSFLIAQDVQAVLPEAVDVKEDEQGTLGLRYTDVVPLLVAAIKEQQAQIEDLKAEVAALKGASA